ASSAHRRRRNRRLVAVATAAILVLALVSVVALTQQQQAAAATDDFHDRQGHAESLRLAGLATDLIGIDPDLPWILAQQALAAADTPEAETAARQVLNAVPPHRSVELPGLPAAMTSDPDSDLVAVSYMDGRTEIRSGKDGSLRVDVPARGETLTAAALAPGGGTVAIQGADLRLVDAASGETRDTVPGEIFLGWVDADHVLISSDGVLAVMDVGSGARTPTQVAVAADTPYAYSVSADGRIATLVGGDQVISVDLRTGQALPAVAVADAVDVATAGDGATAMVMTSGGSPTLVTRGDEGLSVDDAAGFGEHVIAAAAGYLMGSGSGQVQLVEATQRAATRLFTAHRGPATGLGELSDGRLATVGADRYLRIWDLSDQLVRYPRAGTGPDLLPRMSAREFESFRPKISLDADADRLTYTFQVPGFVGSLDARTLDAVGETADFGDITVLTRPLPTAGRLAVVDASGYSGLWDIGGSAARWSCPDSGGRALSAMLMGASDDGQRLALASPFALVSWGATDCAYERTEYGGQGQQPVATLVDGDHHASVVTTAGTWWREGARPVFLTDPGESITAAALAPDGMLLYVTGSGELFGRSGDETRCIGTVPDGLAAFALRPSADGRLVGVIGLHRSVVLDADTGRVAMDLSAGDRDGAEVRDVAISGSTVWAIRADDAVVRRTVQSDDDVDAELTARLPRPLGDDESASLAASTTIGER
ncbi:MAG: hypothetical protein JWN17_1215, partial [Frankiales bacterium]|nr:hypothetical protein [Frankiales bacterium]